LDRFTATVGRRSLGCVTSSQSVYKNMIILSSLCPFACLSIGQLKPHSFQSPKKTSKTTGVQSLSFKSEEIWNPDMRIFEQIEATSEPVEATVSPSGWVCKRDLFVSFYSALLPPRLRLARGACGHIIGSTGRNAQSLAVQTHVKLSRH